jgi:hypothetical protein
MVIIGQPAHVTCPDNLARILPMAALVTIVTRWALARVRARFGEKIVTRTQNWGAYMAARYLEFLTSGAWDIWPP